MRTQICRVALLLNATKMTRAKGFPPDLLKVLHLLVQPSAFGFGLGELVLEERHIVGPVLVLLFDLVLQIVNQLLRHTQLCAQVFLA